MTTSYCLYLSLALATGITPRWVLGFPLVYPEDIQRRTRS